jgi:hypothetical protein
MRRELRGSAHGNAASVLSADAALWKSPVNGALTSNRILSGSSARASSGIQANAIDGGRAE